MFKHKASNGARNLCGQKVKMLRREASPKMSQRLLAEKIQLQGVDVDKTAVKRIENGERYVTDIELKILCNIFDKSADFFLSDDN